MSETKSIVLTGSSNQIILGDPSFLGPTTTLSASTPSASRTVTIPDAGQNSSLLLSAGTKTISGSTTFSSPLTLTASSNQIVAQPNGSGTTCTLSLPQPLSASRVINFPDPGATANIIYDVSIQTISGVKQWLNTIFSTASTNQITFQPGASGPTMVFKASPPSINLNYTIPDVLGNANMVLSTQSSVTQATSISTGVTLNGSSGIITTVSVSILASTAIGTFTFTNSFITTTSVILASICGGSYSAGFPAVVVGAISAGSCTISLMNVGTATLSGTIMISFLVC